MQVVDRLDQGVWAQFVDSNPQGNIFHTPEMFHVFANTKGYAPMILAAVTDDGEPLAMLPSVRISVLRGLFRQLTTRTVAYGSVLCSPTAAGQAGLNLLLRMYKQQINHHSLFSELRNLSDLAAWQPTFEASGFAFEDHLNFLINLKRSPEELWQSIRSSARRNIQKARKLEIEIEEVTERSELPAAYSVLEQVYKRIQVPLPDRSLFEAAFEVLHPKGMLRILVARAQGTAIGALTLLLHKGVMTYWYTGTLREYSSYRAGDLLVWHALELGNQNGLHTFDFGGGGKPGEEYGVRDFKAKFGGTLVNYGRNICVHAPMRLRVTQTGYQLVRKYL